MEREHEAHGALGETSSLIGKYDVKAEEEAIRQVLAGQKELDDVVKTVDAVVDGGGIDALFAELARGDIDQNEAIEEAGPPNASSGVYESEYAFLADALLEFLETPQLPPPSGADWTVHKQHSIASLTPTKDLVQRLEVLPQDYLKARRVTQTYKLAYTRARGEQELLQARSGESRSTWPEAHYLAPLHPIVDWAADRALAALGRSQIYAVRGAVPFPTVLVQVTQTNARGQVVAAGYFTVGFPDPGDPSGTWVTTHLTPLDAVEALALADVNADDITDTAQLQPLVAAAVRAVDEPANGQAEAVRQETDERIKAWIARADAWQFEADALIQRGDVLDRRARMTEEQKQARAMNPERRLTRPLMIAVPTDYLGTES